MDNLSFILRVGVRLHLFSAVFSFGVATPKTKERIEYFDLSYSINNDTIYYPGQKVEFVLSEDIKGYTDSGSWYATYSFCMGEHGGTHVDAPIHFSPTGWTLDEIPPTHFIDVPATVVNVEQKVFGMMGASDKFSLKVEHLIEHEMLHGRIPFKGLVLVHTGWAKYWPEKVKYLGFQNATDGNTSGVSAPAKPFLSFPGLSEEAAKWLANERSIVGVGIDTPSVDIGDSKGSFPVHVLFAKDQIYNIENLANLHLVLKAINKPVTLGAIPGACDLHAFVLPLKVTGATGSPARVLAYCK